MKRTALSLAIVAAVGSMAHSPAQAAPSSPAPFNPVTNYSSNTTDIYMAGSSAVDLGLTKFIAAKLCKTSSLDVYRTDSGATTEYLFVCQTASGLTNVATQLAIHKYTTSSSDGVATVLNGAANKLFLQVADISPSSACAVTGTSVPAVAAISPETGIPAYNLWKCGTTAGTAGIGTQSALNTFGFSDAEPTQFTSSSNTSQLTTIYPYTLGFGIPVTVSVRNALQTLEGLTAGSETDANQPTLSSQEIAGILTGAIIDWTAGFGIPASSLGGDSNIYTARRSNGSGSTKVVDTQLIHDFCSAGVPALFSTTGAVTTSANCTSGNYTASLGTSDDMAACLTSWNSSSLGGVGYLSLDYVPTVGTDGYRFVKVDGLTPNLVNIMEGRYKVWGEASLNYNKAAGLTAAQTAVYNSLETAFTTPAYVAEVDAGLVQPYGTSGAFLTNIKNGVNVGAASPTAHPYTDASVASGPVNPFSHYNTLAGNYNLCQPAQPTSLTSSYVDGGLTQ